MAPYSPAGGSGTIFGASQRRQEDPQHRAREDGPPRPAVDARLPGYLCDDRGLVPLDRDRDDDREGDESDVLEQSHGTVLPSPE